MMNPRDTKSVKRFSVALLLSVVLNVGALLFLFLALIKDQQVDSRPELKVSLSQTGKTSRSKLRAKPKRQSKVQGTQQAGPKSETIPFGEHSDDNAQPSDSFTPVGQEQLESLPTPLRANKIAPKYPSLAERLGIEGDVVLRVEITKTGEVRNALVLEGMGLGADENAVSAIKRYRFEPAKDRFGKAVDSVIKHTIKFRLN